MGKGYGWRDKGNWKKSNMGISRSRADKTLVGVNWVYKTKVNEKGMIERYKATMVSIGFFQQLGLD